MNHGLRFTPDGTCILTLQPGIEVKDVIIEAKGEKDRHFEQVEVVRCRDCQYAVDKFEDGGLGCDRLTGAFKVSEDSFCSFGVGR